MPKKDAMGAAIDVMQALQSGRVTPEDAGEFLQRPKFWQETPSIEYDWIKARVDWCNYYLRKFFKSNTDPIGGINGLSFEIGSQFMADTLKKYGRKQVEEWENRFGLKVIYFSPILCFSKENTSLKNWKIKPGNWFYEQYKDTKIFIQNDGRIKPCDAEYIYGSIVLLIDPRAIPDYKGGRQMWKDDRKFLGGLMKKLRKGGYIQNSDQDRMPLSTRFNIDSNNWEGIIRPVLADHWNLPLESTILEPVLIANLVSQIFTDIPRTAEMSSPRDKRTSVFCEEFYTHRDGDVYRLEQDFHQQTETKFFGYTAVSGLSFATDHTSFRPLGILAKNS